jgi:hypothetical protein
MRLGLSVPAVYIVPVERFCREMGPALGVNLAEFEFPAYFNFFVYKKRCTLVVDSEDAERNIRRVFSETLLGPAQFRRGDDIIEYEKEDFAPDFPREMIPNFNKELKHFRIMPDGKELVLETLLNFRHFEQPEGTRDHENLGIPPPFEDGSLDRASPDPLDAANLDDFDGDGSKREEEIPENRENAAQVPWTYSQAKWIGEYFLLTCCQLDIIVPNKFFWFQAMCPLYGLLMLRKKIYENENANVLKFLRCLVERNTFSMI